MLFRHCFNIGYWRCINIVQCWKSDVEFCLIFNVEKTLIRGWNAGWVWIVPDFEALPSTMNAMLIIIIIIIMSKIQFCYTHTRNIYFASPLQQKWHSIPPTLQDFILQQSISAHYSSLLRTNRCGFLLNQRITAF